MIDAGQSIFAAVGLGIAIAGLLLLAPSRRLALGASAFAIVAGLGAALVFAARAVPPMPAAQATVAVQPSPLPTATTSPAQESAGDMAQREQDLIRPWSEKLDAQERQHKVKIDVLRQESDRARTTAKNEQAKLTAELEQVQTRLRTENAERQRLELNVRELTEALKKSDAQAAGLRATMAAAEAPMLPRPELKPEKAPDAVAPALAPTVAQQASAASAAVAVTDSAGSADRAMLEQGFKTANIALEAMPNRELVTGRPGSYYRVALTNPATGKPFAFEKERYVLADRDADLAAVAATLQAKLVEALPSGVASTVYVRSFASSAAFGQSRAVAPERSNLNRVRHLQAASKDSAIKGAPVEQALSGPYLPAHLPVLRSANVREILSRQLKAATIEIIGADLLPEANPLAQSFELILCVVRP